MLKDVLLDPQPSDHYHFNIPLFFPFSTEVSVGYYKTPQIVWHSGWCTIAVANKITHSQKKDLHFPEHMALHNFDGPTKKFVFHLLEREQHSHTHFSSGQQEKLHPVCVCHKIWPVDGEFLYTYGCTTCGIPFAYIIWLAIFNGIVIVRHVDTTT